MTTLLKILNKKIGSFDHCLSRKSGKVASQIKVRTASLTHKDYFTVTFLVIVLPLEINLKI
jgi:hypothetical protein